MNPFVWSGPAFLVFYAVLVACVLGALKLRRRRPGSSCPASDPHGMDPYAVAILRGGVDEAVRVAAASLVHRGALTVERRRVRRTEGHVQDLHPLEAALLRRCEGERALADLAGKTVRAACEPLQAELVTAGLVPTAEEQRKHHHDRAVAVLVLAGVAIAKVLTALASGHGNVLLLVVAAPIACFFAALVAAPPRTESGEATLRKLRELSLRGEAESSAAPGSEPMSFTTAAATFGLAALPLGLHPWLAEFGDRNERSGGGGGCGGDGGGGDGGCGGCGGCGGGGA